MRKKHHHGHCESPPTQREINKKKKKKIKDGHFSSFSLVEWCADAKTIALPPHADGMLCKRKMKMKLEKITDRRMSECRQPSAMLN